MKTSKHCVLFWIGIALQTTCLFATANNNLHTSWLWHMHQPIYWPDHAPANHAGDHYQNAWDTIQLDNGGFNHPSDTSLPGVFGDANRIQDYQNYPHDAVGGILGLPNAGGQLNFSGALMENVQSLAQAGQYYGSTWNTYNQQAHGWTTSGGKPRMDLTNFTYHHCIAPLVSDETLEMDILIHQRQQQIFWGFGSRGYFPAETCFSEHIIPTLNKLGIAWSIVANNHLTRSCSDFVLAGLGQAGEACDLPNKADQINPAQGAGNYITRGYTSLGCSPTAVAPFAFQTHYARYVDPNTGTTSTLIVVPADQVLGWADSAGTWTDTGANSLINPISSRNNPSKPSILLLAHDGDNAWADGNSYWASWADQFANDAAGQGFDPTTIEQFLSDFPPSTSDIVHVEDGGWVYNQGANDFGSPTFVGWNWPPSYSTNTTPHNVVDPSHGVTDKGDVWRTYVATENRVKTAQQITNSLSGGQYTNRIDQIRDPGSYSQTANAVELGWHYYLGGLDSGFVYFGCNADECWRPVIAQSNAVRNVDPILLGNESLDATPPTVFLPQRSPWNPGTTNFGVEYSSSVYVPSNTDFWVWTYAYDVSGITNVTLLYRANGNNQPPTQDQFKTYAGGPNTASWVRQTMTERSAAAQNTLLPPKYLADYYYAKVTGLSDTYVDYYVSATDSRGNTYNSPIQHVYIAPNAGVPPSIPAPPTNVSATGIATNQMSVSWIGSSGATGYIVYRGGTPIGTTPAPGYTDKGLQASTQYCYTISATNGLGASAQSTTGCGTTQSLPPAGTFPPFVMDGVADSTNYLQTPPGSPMILYAAVRGQMLYVATWSPGSNNNGANDHFIIVADQLSPTMQPAFPDWNKTGQNAVLPTKPFLGGESINTYVGWQQTTASNQTFKAATNAGLMEGTLNLVQAFGSMPSNIYICAAAYSTTNGGALVAQGPPAVIVNGNIESNEFLSLSIPALIDNDGDGVYDRLDPTKDFVIQSVQPSAGGYLITWASVPGKTYQVLACDSLTAGWTNPPIAQVSAGVGQLWLSYSDGSATNVPQRYYRVRLVP